MQPVSGGTQKVTFDKENEREYESQRRAAVAQAAANPYVTGVGMTVKDSRTGYGAPRVMPEQLIEGEMSNFQQGDAPGNAPITDAANTTGNVSTGVSATEIPQEDPQDFQVDALTERLALMRRGGQKRGLNDHDSTYGA
tara:strand:- start:310 stop:726 length:417 start_codon:yes stop_codon:yes gene_type:complete